MTRTQRHFSVAIASAAIVLVAAFSSERWNFDFAQYRGPTRAEPKDEFRFVMVGDRNGGRVPGLMPQAFREINHLYPDFVISVGDLIDGPTKDPNRIPQFWKEFDDEVALLKAPFVYVPGNHDIWDATSKGIYETRYGPTYRSFNYRGLHFITLDTEEMDEKGKKTDRIDGKQLEWLKEDISRNRDARRILVFLHKPIWLTGGLAKASEVWKGLPVHVFAGHDHRYSYQEIDGIPHVILGAVAGGMREEGDAIGRFRHYVLATVQDSELKLALIRLGGVLPPDVVLEHELPGIRLLADSCAMYRDGDEAASPVRIVFRNPLDGPVRVQVQRASQVAGRPKAQPLLPADESLAGGQLWQKTLTNRDLPNSAKLAVADEYRAVFHFTNGQGEAQAIDFPVELRTRRVASLIERTAALQIDGDLTDWPNASWQTLADPAQITLGPSAWKGAEDLSAQFAVARDRDHLYVAARVTDDVVAFNTAIAESDGIELFTACSAKHEFSFARDADLHRLVIAPFARDGLAPGDPAGVARVEQFPRGKWKQLHAAYRREAKGYTVELAIPLSELGWQEHRDNCQIDLAVNDRDLGARRDSQITWSGTERNAYSSRYYGRLQSAAAAEGSR